MMNVKINHNSDNGWYVVDTCCGHRYLRKDGRWYRECMRDGFYATRADAEKALEEYKKTNAAPADSPDQYLGKAASELPDGTVCDIDSVMAYRVIVVGGQLFNVDKDDNKTGGGWLLNNYPVIRIHKLGEQRPKTLTKLTLEWDEDTWYAHGNDGVNTEAGNLERVVHMVRDAAKCLGVEVPDGKVYGKGAESRPSVGVGAR